MYDFKSILLIAIFSTIGVGFVLIFVLSIWSKFRPSAGKKRALRLEFLLIGLGFFCFSVFNIHEVSTSDQITIEGSIANLRQTQGKGHASYFYVRSNLETPQLSCDYSGGRLINGERVVVSYLTNTTTIIDLRVLDGPNAGWTLHEGRGYVTDLFMIALSCVFVVFGANRIPFLGWILKIKRSRARKQRQRQHTVLR